MLIADVQGDEPDLLAGHEWDDFRICDLQGKELLRIPASGAWTMEKLSVALCRSDVTRAIENSFGSNYYLGQQWVGSTEV